MKQVQQLCAEQIKFEIRFALGQEQASHFILAHAKSPEAPLRALRPPTVLVAGFEKLTVTLTLPEGWDRHCAVSSGRKPEEGATMRSANDNHDGGRGAANLFDHMFAHADWWQEARMRLRWASIGTLNRDLGDLALGEPVVLRSSNQWVLGHWYEGSWIKVAKGGHWKLSHFIPLQWAEPTLEDHMLLARE